MPFARTAPLRNELERALPSRPFALRFWDGTGLAATEPDSPTLRFTTPQAFAHVLRAPGELGIGRAYAAGMIEVEDLDGALRVFDTFEPPPLTIRQQLRLALGVVRACGIVAPPRIPSTELRLRGERHTITRDRRAVRHHYDVGNEFFALFLDPSMTYSCGVFSRGATTLEEAQQQKLELICTKLGIHEKGTGAQAGGRVLDVGCGWGGFAIHAASHHGASVLGITLSEPQAQLARERVRAAGLADRIEIRIADYRELSGESFDAITSIEMVEAVGEERIDQYAAKLAGLLSPGGRLLNQGISKLKDFDTPDEGAFSERFVFPDGVPLPLSRVQRALERSGLITTHVEEFQADYAETLRRWIERYEQRYDEAVRHVGAERARIWRLYLRAARLAFETDWASLYQVLAHRPSDDSQAAAHSASGSAPMRAPAQAERPPTLVSLERSAGG